MKLLEVLFAMLLIKIMFLGLIKTYIFGLSQSELNKEKIILEVEKSAKIVSKHWNAD